MYRNITFAINLPFLSRPDDERCHVTPVCLEGLHGEILPNAGKSGSRKQHGYVSATPPPYCPSRKKNLTVLH